MYFNLISQPKEPGYDLKKIISMMKKAYKTNLAETSTVLTFTSTYIIIKINDIEYMFYHNYLVETDDEDENICVQTTLPLGVLLGYQLNNHLRIQFNINDDETIPTFTVINKVISEDFALDGEVRVYDKEDVSSSALSKNIINDAITMKTSTSKMMLHINNVLKVSLDKTTLFNIDEKKVFYDKLKFKYLETNFVFDENFKYIKSIVGEMEKYKLFICKNNREEKHLNIYSDLIEINIYETPIDSYYAGLIKAI